MSMSLVLNERLIGAEWKTIIMLTLCSVKDRKNLERKKKRKVVGYNSYKFSYKGTEWKVKVEIHEKGFEQFYAIVK